ncbi:MAG: response regulator [Dehalococcoidales bacterium]|jgi:DNA-binding NarL/FixJ family response regulator|nr:response regulator [Dehalococcoidales bacterium]
MRVLIADSHPEVRSALKLLLTEKRDVVYIAEATGSDDLTNLLTEVNPDLLLLEWELPGIKPAELVSGILRSNSSISVIIISSRPQVRRVALESGAADFICKSDPPEKLVEALDRCCGGFQGRSRL